MPETDLVLSHDPADRWAVEWLLPRLEAAGLRVYVDRRDAQIGRPKLTNREQALAHSRHTLVIITPRYLANQWNAFENLLAQSADPGALQRRLLRLVLEACPLPPRLAQLEAGRLHQPERLGGRTGATGA